MGQSKSKSKSLVIAIVMILPIGFLVYFMGAGGYGTEIGRLKLNDDFREIQISIQKDQKVIFWTELSVTNESHAYESSLPHLLDYEIEVKQKDKLLYGLKCNPSDWSIASTSSKRGSTDRYYVAKINGCTMNAPGGLITIRAKRKWLKKDKRFNFKTTDLIIKK